MNFLALVSHSEDCMKNIWFPPVHFIRTNVGITYSWWEDCEFGMVDHATSFSTANMNWLSEAVRDIHTGSPGFRGRPFWAQKVSHRRSAPLYWRNSTELSANLNKTVQAWTQHPDWKAKVDQTHESRPELCRTDQRSLLYHAQPRR